MNLRSGRGLSQFMKHAEELRPETDAALENVGRKWTVLGGMEGSGRRCTEQIYYVNIKSGVNLSGLCILWYARNVSGK